MASSSEQTRGIFRALADDFDAQAAAVLRVSEDTQTPAVRASLVALADVLGACGFAFTECAEVGGPEPMAALARATDDYVNAHAEFVPADGMQDADIMRLVDDGCKHHTEGDTA
jgi:hypothetical protein